MGRIMSIDFGRKRCGIAVTDLSRIIANGLTTVGTSQIWVFLEDYLGKELVDEVVIGYPRQMNNQPSQAVEYIDPFREKLVKKYPNMKVTLYDERFTSKMASMAMIEGGMKKKDRQKKELVDKISATIILQSYMEHLKYSSNR